MVHTHRDLHTGAGFAAHRQLPFRHKLLANAERNVGYMEDLEPGSFSFSQTLRDTGYNVGLMGKWHAGEKLTARHFGFDGPHFVGWHNQIDHPDYLATSTRTTTRP